MSKERTYERRFVTSEVEIRTGAGRQRFVEGYAAVFDKRAVIAGLFQESVGRSAFNKTVGEADVRALWNHDPSLLIGRNRAGTLDLAVDNSGLHYRALLPNTSYGNDLAELLERRDITQSSFGFWTVRDSWDDEAGDLPHRQLTEVGLLDVSPVTYPAYEDATSALAIRSAALSGLARRSQCEPGSLCNVEAIRTAIGKQSQEEESRESTQEPEVTAAEKAKRALADLETRSKVEWDWAQ